MATESEVDTTRTAVKTYVPAYQRDEWDADADEMDMSRSEFVRCMVQAGRSDFGLDESIGQTESPDQPPETSIEETEPEPSVEDETDSPNSDRFERRVRQALRNDEYRSWDDLLAEITDDVEDRLEETLQRLQAANEVTYSGRHGGYTLDS